MKELIPKTIHYCWFGKKKLPKSVKQCIKSWRKFCPDYKIIEWNENNFDINCCSFVKDAYKQKAWAFVSDYARLKIIYENGGIYLDTDVEVIKNLDTLLSNSCFLARQQGRNYIATGLGFGATKKHPVIKKLLNEYAKIDFKKAKPEQIACPIIATSALDNEIISTDAHRIEHRTDYTIYPPRYFDPISTGNSKNLLSKKSYSIHHYTASWTSKPNRIKRRLSNFIGQSTVNKIKDHRNNFLKNKPSFRILCYYFIILAILFPQGLCSIYPKYKMIFSLVTWLAVGLICIQSIKDFLYIILKSPKAVINKKEFLKLFGYFIIIAATTILINKSKTTGLQQLFAYPIFFFFILKSSQTHTKQILNIFNNISFLLLSLNLVLSHIFFANSSHIVFMGHVQTISQIGSLALFTSFIYYAIYKQKRCKLFILTLLSLFTMLSVDAFSANFIAFYVIIIILSHKYLNLSLFKSKPKKYALYGLAMSPLIILVSICLNTIIKPLDFSGRGVVWKSTISNIQESPFYGHGIHGSEIKVFWSQWSKNDTKLTYAHNQILQNLLDGGIIALIAFWIMFFTCIKEISNLKDKKIIAMFNIFILSFLIISIFESPSSYCYIYIFLAFCYNSTKIMHTNKKRICNGSNQ